MKGSHNPNSPSHVPSEAHGAAVKNLASITHVLYGDLRLTISNLRSSLAEAASPSLSLEPFVEVPEQSRRYVRNAVAFVEGVTAAMGRVALADVEAGIPNFSQGEIAILRGLRYELDDEGEPRAVPNYQKLTRLVRFSFAILARTYGLRFSLDVQGDGWRCLRSTVRVRNRLLHPRVTEDLNVSTQELREASRAVTWFREQSIGLTREIKARLNARILEVGDSDN